MMQVSDINEYLVTQAPVSVKELLKCLRDKTDCNCLKTANYPSWSGGNQKIVVCTECQNYKLRLRKVKDETKAWHDETKAWQVVDDKSGSEDKTPVTCLEHGTWVQNPAVTSSASYGVLLKPCTYQTHIPTITAGDLAKDPIFKRSIQDSADDGLNADLKQLKPILAIRGQKATDDVLKKSSALVHAEIESELSPLDSYSLLPALVEELTVQNPEMSVKLETDKNGILQSLLVAMPGT